MCEADIGKHAQHFGELKGDLVWVVRIRGKNDLAAKLSYQWQEFGVWVGHGAQPTNDRAHVDLKQGHVLDRLSKCLAYYGKIRLVILINGLVLGE